MKQNVRNMVATKTPKYLSKIVFWINYSTEFMHLEIKRPIQSNLTFIQHLELLLINSMDPFLW
jgi:hypothetical protein